LFFAFPSKEQGVIGHIPFLANSTKKEYLQQFFQSFDVIGVSLSAAPRGRRGHVQQADVLHLEAVYLLRLSVVRCLHLFVLSLDRHQLALDNVATVFNLKLYMMVYIMVY
jgi:hypothetical protein